MLDGAKKMTFDIARISTTRGINFLILSFYQKS